jgi:two-component system, chemotaxis family, sensor kinase CheA
LIEDQELLNLFRSESEERLQHLDQGLLQLEQNPQNQGLLEELFREAHSLKGEARMLGLPDIETIAHRFESILGGAKKGDTALTFAVVDRLYHALDAIRKLVHQAVAGEPAGVVVKEVMVQLGLEGNPGGREKAEPQAEARTTAAPQPHPAAPVEEVPYTPAPPPETVTPPPPKFATVSATLAAAPAKSALAEIPPALAPSTPGEPEEDGAPLAKIQTGSPDGKFHIETIRVATEKLDVLMTYVGELSVTKNRVTHGLGRIEEITGVCERLSRGGVSLRSLLQEIRGTHPNGFYKKLLDYHHQEADLLERLGALLSDLKNFAYEDSSKLDYVANELEGGVRSLRLLPLATILQLFPRMVRDITRSQGKEAQLLIEGEDTTADKRIIEEMKDPLMHMIRNSLDHGIESPAERERLGKPRVGTIRIKAYQTASNIVLEVADDGKGLDLEAIKTTVLKKKLCSPEALDAMPPSEIRVLVFRSGFSTSTFISDVSGRGVGLDVVRTNVERLKGSIQIDSAPGEGSTFRVQLPLTMTTARVLIVGVGPMKYAIQVETVEATQLISLGDIFAMEGQGTVVVDNRPVSVAWLSDLLELGDSGPGKAQERSGSLMAGATIPCVILTMGSERLGLLVDQLLDEQEIVLKTQSKLLQRVRNVSGATILGTGEVCILLNPLDLIKSVRRREFTLQTVGAAEEAVEKKLILMAEDSLTTRTQMKRILEGDGYEVVPAVDGLDAYNKIGGRPFDAMVSDVMMPNMTGLELTEKVRQNIKYRELPIILVTSLSSDEDRQRGLEVGASAYITKPAFDQKMLLDTLRRLI